MSAINFESCLLREFQYEGGYVNNIHDPGGATYQGVTQRVYDAFRRAAGAAVRSVRFMDATEVREIYRRQYWDAVRGDDLWAGLDLCIFDEAVNSGPVRSIMDMQKVLGVTADGHFGMLTLQALRGVNDRAAFINKICDYRLSFLRRLTTFRWFGNGWTSRIKQVRVAALAMARAS